MPRKYSNFPPRMPKYRLHKASGRGIVQYKPLFGMKLHYLPGKFNSEQSLAAYEAVRARVLALHAGKSPPQKPLAHENVTVSILVRRFIAFAIDRWGIDSPTYRHFKSAAKHVRQVAGPLPAAEFGPLALKDVRASMVAAKKRVDKSKTWSRGHVNAQVTKVRRIFKWGVENELVRESVHNALCCVAPLREGYTTAPELPDKTPAPRAAIDALMPFLLPMYAAMVEVQYLTGTRPGEVTQLRIADIDFTDPNCWLFRLEKHKNRWRGGPKKIKIICLGPRAQAFLIPYLQCEPEQFIFRPEVSRAERFAVRKTKKPRKLPAKMRERYTTDSYWKALEYAFRRADDAGVSIERWSPHRLRHSRATLTRQRYGKEGAEAQLGNDAVSTDIYAQKSLPLAIKIATETG